MTTALIIAATTLAAICLGFILSATLVLAVAELRRRRDNELTADAATFHEPTRAQVEWQQRSIAANEASRVDDEWKRISQGGAA